MFKQLDLSGLYGSETWAFEKSEENKLPTWIRPMVLRDISWNKLGGSYYKWKGLLKNNGKKKLLNGLED